MIPGMDQRFPSSSCREIRCRESKVLLQSPKNQGILSRILRVQLQPPPEDPSCSRARSWTPSPKAATFRPRIFGFSSPDPTDLGFSPLLPTPPGRQELRSPNPKPSSLSLPVPAAEGRAPSRVTRNNPSLPHSCSFQAPPPHGFSKPEGGF